MERQLQRTKERLRDRQALINELFFTYRNLLRLLPRLTKRLRGAQVAGVMAEQDHVDQAIAERLWRVASEQGQQPQPCVCDEAASLLQEIKHVADAVAIKRKPANALVMPMLGLRRFLLRAWDALIRSLTPNAHPVTAEELRFREEAKALQHAEAEMHRQLVAFQVALHR